MTKLALALVALLGTTAAQAVTVYTQNFEAGIGPGWSGAGTVQSSAGLSAFGFDNLHLKVDNGTASVLTLTGLAAHTQVTLSFDLALWDSVDLGDRFIINANGTDLYNSTDFGNYFPADNISHGPGVHFTPVFTAFSTPDLGYSSYRDAAQHVSFTFNHSSPTLMVSFRYPDTQGAPDEAFGLDNFVITTNAVPEPAASGLMLMGLLAVGAACRRRRG